MELDSENSSDEDDPDGGLEIVQLHRAIKSLLGDLYKLSFRIRTSHSRLSSTKALVFKEIDCDSGIDIFGSYAFFDNLHVREVLSAARDLRNLEDSIREVDLDALTSGSVMQTQLIPAQLTNKASLLAEYDYLFDRLAQAITTRRRFFGYWRRHALKLARDDKVPDPQLSKAMPVSLKRSKESPTAVNPESVLSPLNTDPEHSTPKFEARTILSGTEATKFDTMLDDQLDTQTIFSYATTAKGSDGETVYLPPPPPEANSKTEFTCPHCFVTCPSTQGQGKAWRYIFAIYHLYDRMS
jgi:hypothetical protein